jgi:hypothetical protein
MQFLKGEVGELNRTAPLYLKYEFFGFGLGLKEAPATFTVLRKSGRYPYTPAMSRPVPMSFHPRPVCCSLLLFFKVLVAVSPFSAFLQDTFFGCF